MVPYSKKSYEIEKGPKNVGWGSGSYMSQLTVLSLILSKKDMRNASLS